LKRYIHVAIAIAMAGSLALMSGHVSAANRGDAGTTPPKLNKNVTLHLWDFFGSEKDNPERIALSGVLNKFTKATGIKAVIDGHPTDSQTKFCTSAPAGTAPDLIGVPHDQVGVLYACKSVAPVPTWAWTPAQQKEYIPAGRVAGLEAGKQYAMPFVIETYGLFYNKALIPSSFFKTPLVKVGKQSVPAPIQWSKVVAKAQSLTDLSNNKFGLAWDINNFYFDYAFLSGNGGYVFKIGKSGFDWQQLGVDTPGSIAGLQFIQDLTTAGKYKLVPSSMTGDVAKGLFDKGAAAMYITGPWDEADMKKNSINFGFEPMPAFGKSASHPFSGLQVFSVNAFSSHKNEAFALLSYISRHFGVPDFDVTGRIPVLTKDLYSKVVQGDPTAKALSQAALAAQPMPNIPEMNQVWGAMGNALGLITKGQKSASDAAHAAATQIKADIAKAHGG
jgi:arabinogalactan oligomer/maltooligosaccharide transport system substrate-binding protein